MATTNLGLTLPTVGGDEDTWGDELNTALTAIDAFAGKLMPGAEATVASASTCDIGAAVTTAVVISGTTTITSFGTATNTVRFVRFSGVLTITHNATSLILPTGANIITAAGDTAVFISNGSGKWRCYQYTGVEVGSYVSSTVLAGSAVALTSTVAADITSISLTPGDWDVEGLVFTGASAGTVTASIIAWVSATSATVPTAPANGIMQLATPATAGATFGVPTGTARFNLTSTTTVYLSVRTVFSVDGENAYGLIRARRVR